MACNSSSYSNSLLGKQRCSFLDWMALQEQDISEMLQAQGVVENCGTRDVLLRQLLEKNVEHFQAYAQERILLASGHVSPFFAPPWCSSLECSLLWIAGCRPSLFIRLIYALSGVEMEARIAEFLEGGSGSELSELPLSAEQLSMIDLLQGRIIKEEKRLSEEMASLQERIADQPFTAIAKESGSVLNRRADEALDDHSTVMLRMLEEADKLRISALKELLTILSPVQAVDFLIASKKLHICVHEWGKKRDLKLG